jgi:hypothetical protein
MNTQCPNTQLGLGHWNLIGIWGLVIGHFRSMIEGPMLTSTDPTLEFINYYGNTSLFALDVLRKQGRLDQMKLLSIGCLMPHLADYLGLFQSVHHNTLVTTRLPMPPGLFPAKFVEHRMDFFGLPALNIDCVISHAAIHCFNDTRYGNARSSDWQKPYLAAGKLREIAGPKRLPVIVSIAVNREEGFFDNNVHLAHGKFVASFERAGFMLREYFFDYVCGGTSFRPEYLEYGYRRSKHLPSQVESPQQWVVGNYFFD